MICNLFVICNFGFEILKYVFRKIRDPGIQVFRQ